MTKFFVKRHMNQLDNRLPNSGMCGSPSLPGLDQHWPPAVAQQYPHVPCLLQGEGQSPLTECIVLCACGWGVGDVRGKVRRGKGGEEGDG